MRASVDYKPNSGATRQLLRSDKARDMVGRSAAEVAARATHGAAYYGSHARLQKQSWHGYAYTGNYAAMEDNARNDTLDKALGGAW